MNSLIRRGNLKGILGLFSMALIMVSYFVVLADSNPSFTLKINPGALNVDVVNVNDNYTPISSPIYRFNEVVASTSCSTGVNAPTMTLGSSVKTDCDLPGAGVCNNTYYSGGNIYIQNPDASSDGFTVSLAASNANTNAFVDSNNNAITYNGGDCNFGNRNITEPYNVVYGGRMYVNPTLGVIANGRCIGLGCTINGLTLGSPSHFDYGVIDSITLLQAEPSADNISDYVVGGIKISQTIPAMIPSGDYSINMTMSVISSGNSGI